MFQLNMDCRRSWAKVQLEQELECRANKLSSPGSRIKNKNKNKIKNKTRAPAEI